MTTIQSTVKRLKYRLPPIPTIRDIVRLYKLRAMRQLSQNFLLDERIVNRIVSSAGRVKDSYVIEVGSGPGSITRAILAKQPTQLTVIEKDVRFVPVLEHLQEAVEDHVRMKIEIGDVFDYRLENAFVNAPIYDWTDFCPPIHIIGNLPFNVATHLIIDWLKLVSEKSSIWAHGRAKMTLTFQKEVAQRFVFVL